jgi:hypothetical protein
MSLAKRPKPAQPSHHSDIQVMHDCRHDPAGNTDLHRRLGRDAFPCCIGTNKHKRREQNSRTDNSDDRFSGELVE